jgi:hypothetical protein
MKTVFAVIILLLATSFAVMPQQTNLQKKVEVQEKLNITAEAAATVKHPTVDYLQTAAQSSIFIYDGNTDPCGPTPVGMILLPEGSGFVVGIGEKGHPADHWRGWKFLITAAHVIGSRADIIVRLNRSDRAAFKCKSLHLVRTGEHQNVFWNTDDKSDLIAIFLPDIGDTDPTVFGYSMLLDSTEMSEWEIKAGTNVFSVGYLYGYSGQTQKQAGHDD